MSGLAVGVRRLDYDLGLYRPHLPPSSPKLGALAETQSRPVFINLETILCSKPNFQFPRGKTNRICKGTRHRVENSNLGLRKLSSTVNPSDLAVATQDLRSYGRSDMQLRSSLQWLADVIVRIDAWQLSSYAPTGKCMEKSIIMAESIASILQTLSVSLSGSLTISLSFIDI
jgi:hypothetical protein